MDFQVKKRFEYKGLPCKVIDQGMGILCGYVGVPKSHPLYGLDDEQISYLEDYPIVHGDITYASSTDPETWQDGDVWWLGFDCGQLNDWTEFTARFNFGRAVPLHKWTVDEVVQELTDLADQVVNFGGWEHGTDGLAF